jgi:membrane associated rhomboid family serine protease
MFIPLGDDVDNRTFPVAGVVLVAVNVLVFAHMLRLATYGGGESTVMSFIATWGLTPAVLADGGLWGLLTHMFLHSGLLHLAGNMIALWAFVHTLESALGSICCAGFFLLWGIAGGITHALMHWDERIPLVGASGGVAGMIGAYCIAFGPMTRIRTLVWIIWPMRIDIPASLFAGVWVLTQLWGLSATGHTASGVAWYAHLGGFAAGVLTMLCVRNQIDLHLVQTAKGTLRFETAPKQQGLATEHLSGAIDAPLNSCPYCGSEGEPTERVGDNLLRCGNTACGRLIFPAR